MCCGGGVREDGAACQLHQLYTDRLRKEPHFHQPSRYWRDERPGAGAVGGPAAPAHGPGAHASDLQMRRTGQGLQHVSRQLQPKAVRLV